ncbi:MAG: CotH kinase family protein [Magnetococcales bacterium]|nr:CotH kinase family protein [Magnetococcales bacterium]
MDIKSSEKPQIWQKLATLLPSQLSGWRVKSYIFIGLLCLLLTWISGIYQGVDLRSRGQHYSFIASVNSYIQDIKDLQIRPIKNWLKGQLLAKPEEISLNIPFKNYQKLSQKRDDLLQQRVVNNTAIDAVKDSDWTKAKIIYKGEQYKVDIRLKGTAADHWGDEKNWSFKIKIKGNKTLFGMRRFALQPPATREFVNEWVFHQLLKHLNLIHLRYKFVRLTLNGTTLPIYAIEENFNKLLIENNQLREGLLFKMQRSSSGGYQVDFYQASRFIKKPLLQKQSQLVNKLMKQFGEGYLLASQVFDSQKMADLLATMDLASNHHVAEIKNLRWYYNPVTSLIEPVGYDNESFLYLNPHNPLIFAMSHNVDPKHPYPMPGDTLVGAILRDPIVYRDYIKSLDKLSSNNFVSDFFRKIDHQWQVRMEILWSSYPWYKFEGHRIFNNNRIVIQQLLHPTGDGLFQSYSNTKAKKVYISSFNPFPISVYGFTGEFSGEVNFPRSITIPGHSKTSSYSLHALPDAVFNALSVNKKLLLRYSVFGSDKISTKKISLPDYRDSLILPTDLSTIPFLHHDTKTNLVTIKPGKWILEQPLILAHGIKLKMGAGTQITLKNRAFILAREAIDLQGTAQNPVIIDSTDNTGQGVVVLGSKAESKLNHVNFIGLKNPNLGGWSVTGGVTFYGSPVAITNTLFKNIAAEDSLNIIRTSFTIDNSQFINAGSDALDLDFANGSINNSSFIKSGNDAVDLSGSHVEAQNIKMKNVGDKALSAGEKSLFNGDNIIIENAQIAIASKDLSKVHLNHIAINNSRIGFAVFQKKAEFGPGYVVASDVKNSNIDNLHYLEVGSSLIINTQNITPTQRKVYNKLYGKK